MSFALQMKAISDKLINEVAYNIAFIPLPSPLLFFFFLLLLLPFLLIFLNIPRRPRHSGAIIKQPQHAKPSGALQQARDNSSLASNNHIIHQLHRPRHDVEAPFLHNGNCNTRSDFSCSCHLFQDFATPTSFAAASLQGANYLFIPTSLNP